MSHQTAFGRRRTPSAQPKRPEPGLQPRQPPIEAADPLAMGAAAEAFRAEVQTRPAAEDEFEQWRRSQRGSRMVAWGLRLALSAPGLISIVMDLSWYLSAGLSLGGLGLGWWLSHERRRHLKAIAAWSAEASWD